MIILDFKVDEEQLIEDLEDSPSTAESGLLVVTYFIMPVRFHVNGVEIFEINDGKHITLYSPLPIMYPASEGLCCIEELPLKKNLTWDLLESGELNLQYESPDRVHIRHPFRKFESTASYVELHKAFLDYREKVRKFLIERVPEMTQHPYWKDWVLGLKDNPFQ